MGQNIVEANFYFGRKAILYQQIILLILLLAFLVGAVCIYQTLFRVKLVAEINHLQGIGNFNLSNSERDIDKWVSINKDKLGQLKSRQDELQKLQQNLLRFVQTDNHLMLQEFKYDKRVSIVGVIYGFSGLQDVNTYFATSQIFGGCKVTAAKKSSDNQYKVNIECEQ
jgi:hypothetical protein